MLNDWIASTELIVVTGDGRETAVTAAIGQPYQSDGAEWRCPVRLSGLHEELAEMAGVDSLQALCMGASLLRALLQDVTDKGGRVLEAARRSEYNLSAVFGRLGELPRDPA
jgi:hypothetical protein